MSQFMKIWQYFGKILKTFEKNTEKFLSSYTKFDRNFEKSLRTSNVIILGELWNDIQTLLGRNSEILIP